MADISDFFNNELPQKLINNPGLAEEIGAVYQFDIEEAGTWTVDLATDKGKVIVGAHEDPGCVVTAHKDDFEKLLDNPASGMMLFTMGKLKVSNVGLALSLQKILG